MSGENKVQFKKGLLYQKSSVTSPGSLFFATDAGKLFLKTGNNPQDIIEIHSDLPFGEVPASGGAVTVDKSIVLTSGLAINLLGDRIPTQLNVNSTGLRDVKVSGQSIASDKTLPSNLILQYIYHQSTNSWSVNYQDGGAAQVQSDWEKNDSTAVDFIKNRPFYEEISEVTVDPSNYVYQAEMEMSICKISDQVYTIEELARFSGSYYFNENTYTFVASDPALVYEEVLPGIAGVLAQNGEVPLLVSSDDFTSIGLSSDYHGTYAMAIPYGQSYYSRLVSLSYSEIHKLANKFLDLGYFDNKLFSISAGTYRDYAYDFRDDVIRYLDAFAFAESYVTDIVIPRVERIGDFALIGNYLGRESGRLIDFSYCRNLNSIGSGVAGISHCNDEWSRYNGVTGIALYGSEKRDYSLLSISRYALNGLYHGVFILNFPYDQSLHDSFLSTMNSQGIYVAFSNSSPASISEMNTIVNSLTDISTISDSWDTILTNINSGNYSQYLLGTKKVYFDYYDTDTAQSYTRCTAYLRCIGLNKDVDSSDNSIKTTWMFSDIEFTSRMQEGSSGYSWADCYLRSFLADSTKFRVYYLDSNDQEVDFSSIVVPAKKTYLSSYVYDKYWIPSVRELNFTDGVNSESSGCVYDQYYTTEKTFLYSCNGSRIRWGRSSQRPLDIGAVIRWWTRTGDSSAKSFIDVNERGKIEDTSKFDSLNSNGVIVGLCI